MKKATTLGIALLIASPLAEIAAAEPASQKPLLVVQITADQLRGDLLDRYSAALQLGFGRLEQSGYWIHRGDVDHALTLSFPGHATLATGMFPSHHGLTANEWWVQTKGAWSEVDVAVDDRYKTLDAPKREGVSPVNMTASTLGEWIKAADPRSKSICLGMGGRIPVAYAGHHADAAYWYDSTINEFTTSSYYAKALAPWIASFNATEFAAFQMPEWTLTVPPQYVALANPDADVHENFGRNFTFPHIYAAESRSARGGGAPQEYSRWFDGTPLKDEALLELAAKAIDAEKLGQRGVTDYLAIDIDSTDSVGHAFGPLSLEQLDTLVRLDRALGALLTHLDSTVGKNRYVVVLSADHGVVDPTDPGVNGRIVTTAELESLLDRVESTARESAANPAELPEKIITVLKSADFIADAYTETRLAQASTDPYIRLYKNVMRPGMTTDFPLWTNKVRPNHPARYNIIVRFKENMVIDAAAAVHGSPYAADRFVPIIFAGSGIRHGEQQAGVRTVDVAPTLAAAAGVAVPRNLDGRVITAALGRPSP